MMHSAESPLEMVSETLYTTSSPARRVGVHQRSTKRWKDLQLRGHYYVLLKARQAGRTPLEGRPHKDR